MLLTVVTLSIGFFSFGWVLTRPLRAEKLAPGQTLISLVHWGDDTEDAIMARLVAAFHAAQSDVRVQRVNPGNAPDVRRKIQTMVAAGTPPDVFQLGWEHIGTWADKGLLEPIEAFIERDAKRGGPDAFSLESMFGPVVDCFRYHAGDRVVGRGKLFAIPKDFTVVGFYYNKDLFKLAGVPFPSPDGWTWDEFLHAARQIGKLPNTYGADFVTWEAMLTVYCWSRGAGISSDGFKTFNFNEPKVLRALADLDAWFKEERTLASAKTQMETSSEPFLTGRIGMAGPFGRWKVPPYREIKDFDWDFAPLPHDPDVKPTSGIFTSAWAMSSGSRNKDAAWKFIRFLSSAEGQRLIAESGVAIPANIAAARSDAFNDPGKPENDHVYLDAVAGARAIGWPPEERYAERFRVQMEQVFKSRTKTVAEALADVQRDFETFQRDDARLYSFPAVNWPIVVTWVATPLAIGAVALVLLWWLRRPSRHALREEAAGLTMISPWLIGLVVFTAFPIALSLILSFCKWSGLVTLDRAQWVGFHNFVSLLTDERFYASLRVTLIYAALSVPLGQAAALAAALLMNQEMRGIGFFRAAWYLPSVLAGVAISILWAWVFHHEHGMLNALLGPVCGAINKLSAVLNLGWSVAAPRWFERDAQHWAVPAFVIMGFWNIGGTMMIYLAGLKGIPAELYEAASIDGARTLKRFWNVTLPMLSPVIFFNVIIAIIASFQVFTQAYVMTGGGPGDATRFYVVYLYNQAFDLHEMGYASAMAWLLMLIILALTLTLMRGSRRFVYYEALKA
ncbi:Lactose transport system permease protein LacF [Phycisphaerae bacterium RAS1]|nr:Lactose transport system permease protein LacF [Phycisphaerae bacterium RAS1]